MSDRDWIVVMRSGDVILFERVRSQKTAWDISDWLKSEHITHKMFYDARTDEEIDKSIRDKA